MIKALRNAASVLFGGTDWEENLYQLRGFILQYEEDYIARPRNSEGIFEVWKLVKHCEVLLDELAVIEGNSTAEAYIANREAEYQKILEDLTGLLAKAGSIMKVFKKDYFKPLKNSFSEKIWLQQTYLRQCHTLCDSFNLKLKRWETDLCREVHGSVNVSDIQSFGRAIAEKVATAQQVHVNNEIKIECVEDSTVAKTLTVLCETDKNDLDEIDYFLLLLRDINYVRHDPIFDRIIEKGTLKVTALRKGLSINASRLFRQKDMEKGVDDQLSYFGPLGIKPVFDFSMFDFTGSAVSLSYMYTEIGTERLRTGKLSKLSKLTVTGETKKRLHTRDEAIRFCFVCPTAFVPEKYDPKKKEYQEPSKLVAQFGGFAYFNENDECIQLNAIYYGGHNVYFNGPFHFSGDETSILMNYRKEERLFEVTIQELADKGVTEIAWINPLEDGVFNHGAFLVNFDKYKKPCYFELVPYDVGHFAGKRNNRNTKFVLDI